MTKYDLGKKQALGFFFGSLLLLSGICPAEAEVKAGEPDYLHRVIEQGWMTPREDGKFHSEQILSRAELAAALVKAFDIDKRTPVHTDPATPVDVPKNHWAYSDIQAMLMNDVMNGYRANRFYPSQQINRAEGFAILGQAYGIFPFQEETVSEILVNYADAEKLPDWTRKGVATVLEAELVNVTPPASAARHEPPGADDPRLEYGDEKPRYRLEPLAPMTRGDLAYALSRYVKRLEEPHSPKGL